MRYKFTRPSQLEDTLLESIDTDLLLPESEDGVLAYFHNGDKMTVSLKDGTIDFDSPHPGEMAGSKLSMRLHQWFAKGLVEPIN